jgi:hypothetical protein
VAEGARLESVYTGNRIEGSNPSLSASTFRFLYSARIYLNEAERLVVTVPFRGNNARRHWHHDPSSVARHPAHNWVTHG